MKKNNSVLLSLPYILWMLAFTLIPLCVVGYYAVTDPTTGAFSLDHLKDLGIYLPGLEPVDAHRGHGAEDRGDAAGQDGDQQGVAQQGQQALVFEQLRILPEGEALELGQVLAGVEGGYHQHRHRQVQEDEDQDGEDPIGPFHTTTLPSSSLPKRFMMPVHTNTRTMSTRLRAAPIFGSLACLNSRSITSPISTVSVLPSFWEM